MEQLVALLPLVVLIVLMYFIMIRPQRKRDKQVQEMRDNLQVGDEIITIGGFFGTIVRVKGEVVTIQVGADRMRMDIAKWGISKKAEAADKETPAPVKKEKDAKEEETGKSKPKKLGHKDAAPEAPEMPEGSEDILAYVAPVEDAPEEAEAEAPAEAAAEEAAPAEAAEEK